MKRAKYNKSKKPQAFILNLYKILEDSQNCAYAHWREDQESFIILNVPKFTEIVLPKYYKHSNYSSFVRQLNMYNFNKMRSQYQREHIFSNQLFKKNNFQSLRNIKRREVISNKSSNILSLAQALEAHINNQNNESNSEKQDSLQISPNQIVQLAAPSSEFNFFLDLPNFDQLKLSRTVSDYLIQSQKINNQVPSIITLKSQQTIFPLKATFDELKQSQTNLEQICVGLYKQNEFLTNQNKRLQQKLKIQFKKKDQILNQIIKYVISYLSQWNQYSTEMKQNNDFSNERIISDEQNSSDVILESYDLFQKRKFQKSSEYKKQQHSSKKGFTFSKYARNQRKILLTLLKQIQKSYYSQKFFFTGSGLGSNYEDKQDYNFASKSANTFLMSMLLKFIESNNLTQVIQRFSFLLNLERNRKNKNFTVVNYMKDLTQHFKLKEFEKQQNFQYQKQAIMSSQNNTNCINFLDKQRYLQNQKETINQMQKQLALITRKNLVSNQISYDQQDIDQIQFMSGEFPHLVNRQIFVDNQKTQIPIKRFEKLKLKSKNLFNGKKSTLHHQKQSFSDLNGYLNEKLILDEKSQKFIFRKQDFNHQ